MTMHMGMTAHMGRRLALAPVLLGALAIFAPPALAQMPTSISVDRSGGADPAQVDVELRGFDGNLSGAASLHCGLGFFSGVLPGDLVAKIEGQVANADLANQNRDQWTGAAEETGTQTFKDERGNTVTLHPGRGVNTVTQAMLDLSSAMYEAEDYLILSNPFPPHAAPRAPAVTRVGMGGNGGMGGDDADGHLALEDVKLRAYEIQDLGHAIVNSSYDMVVLDPTKTKGC